MTAAVCDASQARAPCVDSLLFSTALLSSHPLTAIPPHGPMLSCSSYIKHPSLDGRSETNNKLHASSAFWSRGSPFSFFVMYVPLPPADAWCGWLSGAGPHRSGFGPSSPSSSFSPGKGWVSSDRATGPKTMDSQHRKKGTDDGSSSQQSRRLFGI